MELEYEEMIEEIEAFLEEAVLSSNQQIGTLLDALNEAAEDEDSETDE